MGCQQAQKHQTDKYPVNSYHGCTCPKSGSDVNFTCTGCRKRGVKWQQVVVLHGRGVRKLLIQRDREAQEAGGGGKPAPGERL